MSTVIGIRVPKKLKEELDKLNIKYHDEIRKFLEKRIREEKMKRIMKKIDDIRKQTERTDKNVAAEFVREDRDKEWV